MKKDTVYFSLLKKFCDGLIALQDMSDDPAFRGGIRCRACKMIHGRCPDGVFAFVEMYKETLYLRDIIRLLRNCCPIMRSIFIRRVKGLMIADFIANWNSFFHSMTMILFILT